MPPVQSSSFVHVRSNGDSISTCTCQPATLAARPCVHKDFALRHLPFLVELPLPPILPPPPVRQLACLDQPLLFSIIQSSADNGRRVSLFLDRTGRWVCSSRSCGKTCDHVAQARAYMLHSGNKDAEEDILALASSAEEQGAEERGSYSASAPLASISFQPRALPPWARVDRLDAKSAGGGSPHPPPLTPSSVPTRLDLSLSSARCRCGHTITSLKSSLPDHEWKALRATEREAVVFGPSWAVRTKIELIRCDKHGNGLSFIGSDLSELGRELSHCLRCLCLAELAPSVFNWNNNIIFTHELFDSFLSLLLASGTPFNAFHATVERQYEYHAVDVPFPSVDTFRRAALRYIDLLNTESTMACPDCGGEPRHVIVDGYCGLSFQAGRATGGISGPTVIVDDAPSHDDVDFKNAAGAKLFSATNLGISTSAACTARDIDSARRKLQSWAKDEDSLIAGSTIPQAVVAVLAFSSPLPPDRARPATVEPAPVPASELVQFLEYFVSSSGPRRTALRTLLKTVSHLGNCRRHCCAHSGTDEPCSARVCRPPFRAGPTSQASTDRHPAPRPRSVLPALGSRPCWRPPLPRHFCSVERRLGRSRARSVARAAPLVLGRAHARPLDEARAAQAGGQSGRV